MGLEENVYVGILVIDMYCKCGRVVIVRRVFEWMKKKNVKIWSVMIVGYGMYGYVREVLDVFYDMKRVGVKLNYIIFVLVLVVCSYVGFVEEGWDCFISMK